MESGITDNNKIKKSISLNKIKLQRGYSYISVLGVPFLATRELGEIFPKINWVILFIAAITGIWLLGHFDSKKGLLGNELEYAFRKNPEWVRKMEKNKKQKEDDGKNKHKTI